MIAERNRSRKPTVGCCSSGDDDPIIEADAEDLGHIPGPIDPEIARPADRPAVRERGVRTGVSPPDRGTGPSRPGRTYKAGFEREVFLVRLEDLDLAPIGRKVVVKSLGGRRWSENDCRTEPSFSTVHMHPLDRTGSFLGGHSTVTLLARFRGLSMSQPLSRATW